MTDSKATSAPIATTGLLLLLVALTVMAVGPAHLNHDAAWYLYVVERWPGGATLYRDVLDTNPPLIVWLSTPAVWAAGLAGRFFDVLGAKPIAGRTFLPSDESRRAVVGGRAEQGPRRGVMLSARGPNVFLHRHEGSRRSLHARR